MASTPWASYRIHQCVFENDVATLASLLTDFNVNGKDKHGNTALHLAAMLGRKECIKILLERNASVYEHNLGGWTALNEAVSFGDRETILAMVRQSNIQLQRYARGVIPKLAATLIEIPHFVMELKWEITSCITCVSCLLRPGICLVRKGGSCLLVEMDLPDIETWPSELGPAIILLDLNQPANQMITLINHNTRTFFFIDITQMETDYEKDADELMSEESMSDKSETDDVTFTRARTGCFCTGDKRKTVGQFKADVYDAKVIGLRYRREHLIAKPVLTENSKHRPSLLPPRNPTVSWHTYIHSPVGEYPTLGRKHVIRIDKKGVKAKISMSTDFPLTKAMLQNLIFAVTPVEYLKELQDLFLRVPPGFPVQVVVPIVPTIKAKVTFQKCRLDSGLSEDWFKVPAGYTEIHPDKPKQ